MSLGCEWDGFILFFIKGGGTNVSFSLKYCISLRIVSLFIASMKDVMPILVSETIRVGAFPPFDISLSLFLIFSMKIENLYYVYVQKKNPKCKSSHELFKFKTLPAKLIHPLSPTCNETHTVSAQESQYALKVFQTWFWHP